MQPPSPIACWQCGTVLSAPGGRCPACGVEQRNPPNLSSYGSATSAAPRRGRVIEAEKGKSTPWIVLAVGLVAIAVLGLLFAPRSSKLLETEQAPRGEATPASAAAGSAPPNELGVRDFTAVDPTEALGRARARAIAWHPDAILISVYAAPVGETGVNLEAGGLVEYVFGRPTGEGFGAGARVSKQRFTIKLSRGGETTAETAVGPGRAAIDPNCPFDEALKKARAAGFPKEVPLVVAYEFSEKHDRTVYRVYPAPARGSAAPEDALAARALDGQTCAILVR